MEQRGGGGDGDEEYDVDFSLSFFSKEHAPADMEIVLDSCVSALRASSTCVLANTWMHVVFFF
jgi:hypothetical protein